MKNIAKFAAIAAISAQAFGIGSAIAQEKIIPRIGFVAGAGGYPKMAVTNKAFFDGLAEAGYVDGTTMKVIFRTAEGNMSLMPELLAAVLAEKVDYVVVSTSPGCAAAQAATTTLPVLCISVQDDPVKEGLTATLDHGNGNLVGVHSYLPDGITRQLSMLQQLKPGLRTLGVLFNPMNPTHKRLLGGWERATADRGIKVLAMPAVDPRDLPRAVAEAKAQGAELAIGLLGADTYAMRKEIAEASTTYGLPIAMDTPGGYTQMGGVATMGVDIVPLYRRGALEQMVPMLRGQKPSALPWIGPKDAVMKVNDEVAKRFGLDSSAK